MTKDEALRLALEALETIERCEPSYSKIWSLKDNARLTITAIKAALEAKDEPVGWAEHGVINWLADKQFNHTSFLYATPSQRTWVGLTADEMESLYQQATYMDDTDHIHMLMMAEAKLKEKNNA
jgi:hypothetical protein